jgi:chromosome segregation ATPase
VRDAQRLISELEEMIEKLTQERDDAQAEALGYRYDIEALERSLDGADAELAAAGDALEAVNEELAQAAALATGRDVG